MSDPIVSRQSGRVLSERESNEVADLNLAIDSFINICNSLPKSREVSLAITNAEQAAMWATKAATK